jgi:HPt (histidine-containing phosphotransfer) domain-containing protein
MESANWKQLNPDTVAQLVMLADGDAGFLEGLVQEFAHDAERTLIQLEGLSNAGSDAKAATDLLHRLRGQCLNLGFEGLAASLLELEQKAKQGEVLDAAVWPQVRAVLPALQHQLLAELQ